jgi:1-phosphofructokinase family hexose kinase
MQTGDLPFLTVCLNPTLQKTIVLKNLLENEVNRSNEYYLDASGKGINVSRVLTQLGAKVIHLTQAGGRNREWFLELAARDGIECSWVESNSEIRFCYTLINSGHQTSTEIVEEGPPVDTGTEERVYREYHKLLPSCRTVIISGTKAAGFSNDFYPNMVREAKKMGKIVILDIKGNDLIQVLPYKPDIIKPNLSEFCATFLEEITLNESSVQDEIMDDVQAKMAEIYEKSGIITILTRGKYGVLYINQGKVISIPAEKIKPVNTIGCGDAFTAGLVYTWQSEVDTPKAIRKGMECAGLNALSVHPGVIK